MRGLFLAIKAFLPTANGTGSAVFALTSQTIAFPVAIGPGMSGYNASKIAQIKVMEYLAAEPPTVKQPQFTLASATLLYLLGAE